MEATTTGNVYPEATRERIAAMLRTLSLPDLDRLIPGMVRAGGDGLGLLRAEIKRRRDARQDTYPPQAA